MKVKVQQQPSRTATAQMYKNNMYVTARLSCMPTTENHNVNGGVVNVTYDLGYTT